MFGLLPIKAGMRGVTSVAGQSVREEALVYPLLRILIMGMSWAVHWAQSAHRHLIESCPSSSSFTVSSSSVYGIIDGRPPPRWISSVWLTSTISFGRRKAEVFQTRPVQWPRLILHVWVFPSMELRTTSRSWTAYAWSSTGSIIPAAPPLGDAGGFGGEQHVAKPTVCHWCSGRGHAWSLDSGHAC